MYVRNGPVDVFGRDGENCGERRVVDSGGDGVCCFADRCRHRIRTSLENLGNCIGAGKLTLSRCRIIDGSLIWSVLLKNQQRQEYFTAAKPSQTTAAQRLGCRETKRKIRAELAKSLNIVEC
jgi:hypothetical protein